MHGDRLADDETIVDELADGLAGVCSGNRWVGQLVISPCTSVSYF